MENTWYENHMMFDVRGNYSASDDYAHDYNEDIYIQCCKCNDYAHPAKGIAGSAFAAIKNSFPTLTAGVPQNLKQIADFTERVQSHCPI